MKITILCDSVEHPVNKMLQEWCKKHQAKHEINLVQNKESLTSGNILFLISCNEIITSNARAKYDKTLVIHASDLPKGRGWSPHIWALLDGADKITVCLLEAENKVDSGAIWKKVDVSIPKHALYDEINSILFETESNLMDFAVEHFHKVTPRSQNDCGESSYYPLRSPKDSEIDTDSSIAGQFDLLRTCDPKRYPAYFRIHGHSYKIILEKINGK